MDIYEYTAKPTKMQYYKTEELLSQKILCKSCLFYYFQLLPSDQKYSFTG